MFLFTLRYPSPTPLSLLLLHTHLSPLLIHAFVRSRCILHAMHFVSTMLCARLIHESLNAFALKVDLSSSLTMQTFEWVRLIPLDPEHWSCLKSCISFRLSFKEDLNWHENLCELKSLTRFSCNIPKLESIRNTSKLSLDFNLKTFERHHQKFILKSHQQADCVIL